MQAIPSIDSISFDTSDLHLESDEDGVRIWHTESGDGLGLYYYPLPPDIHANMASVTEVRSFYRQSCAKSGAAIIEVDTLIIDDCKASRTIIKVPQQPTGMTYVGAITLPFRDLSFVVKIQCEEHGTTGIREAIIGARMMGDGQINIYKNGFQGWTQDSYDPTFVGELARNLSEAAQYDEDFPDHPLSRLRPILQGLEETICLAAELQAEPAFIYESSQKPSRWWSRLFGRIR